MFKIMVEDSNRHVNCIKVMHRRWISANNQVLVKEENVIYSCDHQRINGVLTNSKCEN